MNEGWEWQGTEAQTFERDMMGDGNQGVSVQRARCLILILHPKGQTCQMIYFKTNRVRSLVT